MSIIEGEWTDNKCLLSCGFVGVNILSWTLGKALSGYPRLATPYPFCLTKKPRVNKQLSLPRCIQNLCISVLACKFYVQKIGPTFLNPNIWPRTKHSRSKPQHLDETEITVTTWLKRTLTSKFCGYQFLYVNFMSKRLDQHL